ncbi:hypothetical protein BAZMOX_449338_0 [methanotrophic endosymbiont of Bathymodiolus azoricus (Menez Gwen)]|nr:hypothetical protein BAZMOX_449338_0 [methanotrophic endosymbiont of Bathymodiolus azoricus (Menez Gwen)]
MFMSLVSITKYAGEIIAGSLSAYNASRIVSSRPTCIAE